VFGATGFLGRAIVRELADDGWKVCIAARNPDVLIPGIATDRSVRLPTDIRDERSVAAALEGASAAVNAVSLYKQQPGLRFRDIHVEGAARVARCAREAGVDRLVHVSGIGASSQSSSAYVRARGQGEASVQEAFEQATIVRPSVMFGPGGGIMDSLQTVSRLPLLPMFGRGSTRLQPVLVDDVATAIGAILRRPESAGRIYELGGADLLAYREILAQVLRGSGRKRPLVPVPFALWRFVAGLLAMLPRPPLTISQVQLMEMDNIADPSRPGFAELDISPSGIGEALDAIRKHGEERQ
jgi:NADH dehydrogenase